MYFVYIMASRRNGTLYTGVTNDLARRAYEHREGLLPGFTRKYGVKMLVFYEPYDDIRFAIQREKNMKKWPRAWKIRVIEAMNPEWWDLYDDLAKGSSARLTVHVATGRPFSCHCRACPGNPGSGPTRSSGCPGQTRA